MTHPHDRHLTPSTLRLLVGVQDLGGIGAAARAEGMTQPAASRTLSALERHLGYPLLERSPRGAELTRAGLALAAQARLTLAEHDRLAATAEALGERGPQRLELAASRTIGEHLVPGWLGAQAAAHPDTWVSFRFDNSAAVVRWVQDGTVPLGFIEDPVAPEGLETLTLREDRLAVIVPPGHAWAGGSVGPELLASTPLVEREEGSGTRATLDSALPRRRRPLAVLDSNAAIVSAVAAGLGPAVLSEMAVAQQVYDGAVAQVRWEGPVLERPLRALWQPRAKMPRAVSDFLRVVRAER